MLSEVKEPKPVAQEKEITAKKSISLRSFQCQYNGAVSDMDRPSDCFDRREYSRGIERDSEATNYYHGRRYYSDSMYPQSPRHDRIYNMRNSDDKKYYRDERCSERAYDRERYCRMRRPEFREYEERMYDRERYSPRRDDRERYDRDDRYEERCGACAGGRREPDQVSHSSASDTECSPVRDSAFIKSPRPVTADLKPKKELLPEPSLMEELSEQREALDKMVELWQELVKRFQHVTVNVGRSERTVQDTAAAAREVATAQARLWRECMERYESVARDVGDTDARLKEELDKQKNEIVEMSSMWRECLDRYKEMSTNLDAIKQEVLCAPTARPHSPPPVPPPAPRPAHDDYSPPVTPMPYTLPHGHPYQMMYGGGVAGPASVAPPAWWWPPPAPRRTDSRDSRSDSEGRRERRHRHRDHDHDRERRRDRKSASREKCRYHRH